MAAGRRAFALKGLAGANLKRDILAPASVSVGSFYHQFRDKTELLLAIMDEYAESFRDRLAEVHRAREGKTALEIASDSYAMILDSVDENRDLFRIQLRERGSDDDRIRRSMRKSRERWTTSVADDYRRIAAAGGFDVEADLLASITVDLAVGAMAEYLEAPRHRRRALRQHLLDGLVRFTMGGIPALVKPSEAVFPLATFEPRIPFASGDR
jgi:AcrR family transcriptional regulator